MLSKRLSDGLCLVVAVLLFAASGALGQVDWSDLFPEEGKPAAKPAAPAAPAPAPAAPPSLGHSVQRAPQVAKPLAAMEAPKHAIRSKAAPRRVASRPHGRTDREFPSAADVAPPKFDRQSQRRSSPPPATIEEKTAAVEEAEPARAPAPQVIAKAEPAPAVLAAREPDPETVQAPAPAPVRANKVERPVAHESAPMAAASEPVAAPEPAVVSRAARAAAAQQATARIAAEAAPVRAEASTDDAPIQVAAASAETAMTTGNRHRNAPASDDDTMAASGVQPGDVIAEKNMAQYANVLTPGLEWALRYGLRMKVVAPRHVRMIRPYLEATEKYSGQVKLSPDGTRLINWTAGQPFPNIDTNDPQAALKIMWNYTYGWQITDDVNAELFDADTGSIGKNRGMTVERHYMIDNLRRLNYTGRLFVDPKPQMPNPDGVRYKESLHPLSEPFDLKGVGSTYYRYIDPDRQDDSWLYLPQLRRVRRLSTAQRSDALFGQDTDLDSYYGYSGNIAWMDWKFLGERTVMGVMHAENAPAKWQQPEDWLIDEVWEPRAVYVLEGTSKLAQYAYGKRVLYLDKESIGVVTSDIYDKAGQLWKVWINSFAYKKEAIPGAKISRYPEDMVFTTAIMMLDTQLVHATKASLPSTQSQGQECIFLNMGEKSGTKEDFFTVANLIEMGH